MVRVSTYGPLLKDFSWSLRPLLVCMKLIGVYFPTAQLNQSRASKLASVFYNVAVFGVHVAGYASSYALYNYGQGLEGTSLLFSFSRIFGYTGQVVHAIAIHLVLLTQIRRGAGSIWIVVQKMEADFRFHESVYLRFRRLSATGVCFVISTVIITDYLLSYYILLLSYTLLTSRHYL